MIKVIWNHNLNGLAGRPQPVGLFEGVDQGNKQGIPFGNER